MTNTQKEECLRRGNYELKKQFVLNYFDEVEVIDVYHTKFIDDYIKEFNPKYKVQPYGPNTCRDAGKILSKMYKEGLLTRTALGLNGFAGLNYAKWTYCYEKVKQ